MRIKITLFLLLIGWSISYGQLNFTQISNVGYNIHISDIWGYVAPDGTEYALVGADNGLSIVSLADPNNPVIVATIPGQQSFWRDIKTWNDFAYVTADESGTTDGLLIVDLTQLPDAAPFSNWNPVMPDGATLNTCHNLFIDEFGVAYLAGCNSNGGGLIFVDVDTDPANPSILGVGSSEYSHDVYVRDNLAYSSEINNGVFAVYDVTDKTNATLQATQSTAFNFTHNAWLSDDGLTLFTTDEVADAPVGSYDVSDLDDIKELDQFVPFATLNEGTSPHNVHVWNDYLIISYYENGCLLVDAARPDNLIEVGFFDSFTTPGFTFDGAWGAYPFLPSGLVLLTDQANGLFVLEPNYVRACYLEGIVTDASNNVPLFGATVAFVGNPTFENTDLVGEYKTGIATAGTYDVLVSKPGYASQLATVELENGEVTNLNIALVPLTPFEVTGKVVDAATGLPIQNAQVNISNADFDFNTVTDANGDYTLSIFEGDYTFFAGIWGYKTAGGITQSFEPGSPDLGTTELEEGYEDVFSLDLGWEVVADGFQANFERSVAAGYDIPQAGLTLQPFADVSEDIGNSYYVTGSSTDLFGSVYVGGGLTAIVSPEFDLSGMNAPEVSFYSWFYTLNPPQGGGYPVAGDDLLIAKLTNGTDTVVVHEQSTQNFFQFPMFEEIVVSVIDIIDPTATMKFIVEIEENNGGDITEAVIDYFQAYDSDPNSISNVNSGSVQLTVTPNPATDDVFVINYKLDDFADHAQLIMTDVLGKVVFTTKIDHNEGQIEVVEPLSKGTYFVQIQSDHEIKKTILMVKN